MLESIGSTVRVDSGVWRTEWREALEVREIDLDADFGRTSE